MTIRPASVDFVSGRSVPLAMHACVGPDGRGLLPAKCGKVNHQHPKWMPSRMPSSVSRNQAWTQS